MTTLVAPTVALPHSIFVPEEKAGTIVCQRIALLPLIDSRRERLRQRTSYIRLLHLTGLVPQGFVIEHLYYGIDESGTRGLFMSLLSLSEHVAGVN